MKFAMHMIGLLALLAIASTATACLPQEHALSRATDHMLVHDYQTAETILDSLAAANPDCADIHYSRMVLYYAWLDDFGTVDSLRPFFIDALDSTLHLSAKALKKNDKDAWAHYYKGTAHTYRSLFRSYTEGIGMGNVRALYRDASSGIDEMKKAGKLDPGMNDVLLGVGKYLNWRGGHLPWPFSSSSDQKKGIRKMEEGFRKGLRWHPGGVQALGSIYMHEKRYDEVLTIAEPMMEKYPNSRFFSILVAKAYMYKGDHARADSLFTLIQKRMSRDERNSRFVDLKVRRWIAELRLMQGRKSEACTLATELIERKYPGIHPDWLRRKLKSPRKTRKTACRDR
jgi:tetratricopeptide (TPR) repeat protein